MIEEIKQQDKSEGLIEISTSFGDYQYYYYQFSWKIENSRQEVRLTVQACRYFFNFKCDQATTRNLIKGQFRKHYKAVDRSVTLQNFA